MYSVVEQTNLVHNNDWDVMFLLDATRFDIFSTVYKDIFGSSCTLKKAVSPSTWSGGWLLEMFKGKMDDVVFLSPDKSVNSYGFTEDIFDFVERLKYNNQWFDGREHFKKIIDVWEYGKDEKVGFVYPEVMCEELLKTVKKYPNDRFITNFFQIHDPFLYYLRQGETGVYKKIWDSESWTKKMHKWTGLKIVVNKFLNDEQLWRIRKNIGMVSDGGLNMLWAKYGREGIIKGYTEDLKYTLTCINNTIKKLSNKKIVITSDHGERLGERGRYGHGYKKDKEVTNVPWLEVVKNENKKGNVDKPV